MILLVVLSVDAFTYNTCIVSKKYSVCAWDLMQEVWSKTDPCGIKVESLLSLFEEQLD